MRHAKFLMMIAAIAFGSSAFAQIETCYESSKELYKDIQIYNETYKVNAAKPVIGSRLEFDMSLFNNPALGKHERVKSLETAFAKCDMNMNQAEQKILEAEIQEAKSSLNQ